MQQCQWRVFLSHCPLYLRRCHRIAAPTRSVAWKERNLPDNQIQMKGLLHSVQNINKHIYKNIKRIKREIYIEIRREYAKGMVFTKQFDFKKKIIWNKICKSQKKYKKVKIWDLVTAKAPKKMPMAAPQLKLAPTRGWKIRFLWNEITLFIEIPSLSKEHDPSFGKN